MEKWKVLVMIAHPDDETPCGGTIAKLAKQGHEVVIAVATNGNKGTHDSRVTPERIAQIRRREMERACELLGVSKLIWFGLDDGTLRENPFLKERVYRTIRTEKPDILITFDPWKKWDFHPDHRTIGHLATEAGYLADGCWYFPEHMAEGIEPCKPREMYLFWSDEPNYAVDITDTFEQKYRAADAHVSQGSENMTFGRKHLEWLKSVVGTEEALYRETYRKVYQTALTI